MYESIWMDGVSSATIPGLKVMGGSVPLLQIGSYGYAAIPGRMAVVREDAPQIKPMDITLELAVIGSSPSDVRAKWRAALRYLAAGRVLRLSDAPGDFYRGRVISIKAGEETPNWIRGTAIFSANPPCALRSLGANALIPSPLLPVPEQLTDANSTCIGAFTAAGTMPAVAESGLFPPEVYLAITGTFGSLSLGGAAGLVISYATPQSMTIYVDTENMVAYHRLGGVMQSLAGSVSGEYGALAQSIAALPIAGESLNISVRMLAIERG